MVTLLHHSNEWNLFFDKESTDLKEIFKKNLLNIQHIGSTSVSDLLAKPIIDIAVQIASYKEADQFIKPLQELGYIYKPELSSVERHFFQKGEPIQFHLSIAYLDRGNYWDRQILFRDYLKKHAEARREYEKIKINGINKDEFVQRILSLASS